MSHPEIVEFFLRAPKRDCKYTDKCEIKKPCIQNWNNDVHRICSRDRCRYADNLHHGDRVRQRRVFYKRHDLITHRRKNAFDHLQQHDPKKDLRTRHAQYLPRLILAFGDAFDPAAVYLRKIASVVNNKSNQCRQKTIAEGGQPDQTRSIENDEKLQHKRRAADYPHDHTEQCFQREKLGHRAECDNKPERQCKYQCKSEQLERRQKTDRKFADDIKKHPESPFMLRSTP